MPLPDYLSLSNTLSEWLRTTNNLISYVDNTSVYILVSQNATPRVTTGNISVNGTITVGTTTINTIAIAASNGSFTNILTINSASLSGNLTANGTNGTSGQVLTSNGTGVYWSTAGAVANSSGGTGAIQYYNGTTLGSSGNLIFSGTNIFVGNTTANGNYGQTSVAVANSTNTATLTPISLTIGTTVVNTTATSLGGTLSITGATNVLSTLGVSGATKLTGAVNVLSTLGVTGVSTFVANVICDTNTLVIDTTNHRVGIGNTTPSYLLDVNGTTRVKQVTANSVLIANSNATHIATWSAADGSYFRIAATGNFILNGPSNPLDGQKIIIKHFASGGARTLTLNTTSFAYGTDITSSSITATSSALSDVIGCVYDANHSSGKWLVVAYVKGY